MHKPFFRLVNLLFIANHMLGSVVFIYFLNWYDTGRWDSDGSIFMALGGFLAGTIALIIELQLYHKFELWPRNTALFFVRLVASSIVLVALSFAVGYVGIFVMELFAPNNSPKTPFAALLVIPFMAAFYLPMMTPFGVLVGLINSVLLLRVHVVHRQDERI